MKMILNIFAVIACMSIGTSFAQQVSAKPARAKPKTAAPAATPTPATAPEPKVETPPPAPPFEPVFYSEEKPLTAYLVNDPPKVYAWVEANLSDVPKVDQFSTREERDARDKVIQDKLGSIGMIPMTVHRCTGKYDADNQKFKIQTGVFGYRDIMLKSPNPEAENLRKVILYSKTISEETYAAQNAYGATTEVKRTNLEEIALGVPGDGRSEPAKIVSDGSDYSRIKMPYNYTFHYYGDTLSMPPAQAREANADMGCLVVAKLKAPYVFRYKEHDAAKRDMPFEHNRGGSSMYGTVQQFVIFNKKTGDVYAKHAVAE